MDTHYCREEADLLVNKSLVQIPQFFVPVCLE